MTRVVTIVHVVYQFDTGGLENGVVNLINTLPESDYQHHVVALAGYNEDFARRVTTNNLSLYDLEKKPGNDRSIFGKLNRLLKQIQPDILHTRNTATIEMQLVGWWRRVPLRIHGEHGWDVNDMHGQNRKYQILRRIMRRFIHRYVALSSEAFEYLQHTIGVARPKIHHICNGVNTTKFFPLQGNKPIPAEFNSAFFDDDALVIGTVGRLAEVKNQTFLLEAFIRLCQQHPEHAQKLRLLIVGDGVLMAPLQQRVEEAGLTSQVLLAGNRSDVPQMMQCMDLFVLPSLAEGISNTILEAMSTGLPVVATRVGGNPDLIMPQMQRTHLVEVNNHADLVAALQPYLTSPAKLAEDKSNVRQYCLDHFSINSMVDKYHQLYQLTAKQE